MGLTCSACCANQNEKKRTNSGYQTIPELNPDLKDDPKTKSQESTTSTISNEPVLNFLELQNDLLHSPYIKHAAVINFADGKVLVSDFEYDKEGIRDVVRAFKARPQFIKDEGIRLGEDLPKFVISEMERNNFVHGVLEEEKERATNKYGTTGYTQGCTVRRTLSCILIVVYEGNLDLARAFVRKTAASLVDRGF